MLGLIFVGASLHAYFLKKNFTPTQRYISSVVKEFNVRRHFDGRAYGTFWDYCGVTMTADHVQAEMEDHGESFVGKPAERSHGIIDAAHYGRWSCDEPREPTIGERVAVIGFPGGSEHPTLRRGEIHAKRIDSGSDGYEKPTYIVVFHSGEPVVGGMSGGIIISGDRTPLGPLVTQNSPAYFPKFEDEKHSADFASLYDYWTFVLEPRS